MLCHSLSGVRYVAPHFPHFLYSSPTLGELTTRDSVCAPHDGQLYEVQRRYMRRILPRTFHPVPTLYLKPTTSGVVPVCYQSVWVGAIPTRHNRKLLIRQGTSFFLNRLSGVRLSSGPPFVCNESRVDLTESFAQSFAQNAARDAGNSSRAFSASKVQSVL